MKKTFTLLLMASGLQVFAQNPISTDLVISQVYGGAGCTTANCSTFGNDYIEIFNRGTTAVDLFGYSVQYTSATGPTTSWGVTPLATASFLLQPKKYYLVAQSGNANGVNPIPTPDATGTLSMSATTGKVALVNNTTALTSSTCTASPSIVDLVGYGPTATCFETAPVGLLSTTTAAIRNNNGCAETGNNANDFTIAAPAPRNNATAASSCTTTPISLYYFIAQKGEKFNSLKWQVNCLSTSVNFQIQRSAEGRVFEDIYSEDASQARCAAAFSYNDLNRLGGSNYYRLKINDIDGTVSYSTIVLVVNGLTGKNNISINPNVVSAEVSVKYNSPASENVQWIISDMQGRVVKKIDVSVKEGENRLSIQATDLKAGQYILKGYTGNGSTQGARFIKN